jgi:hypothetical protein
MRPTGRISGRDSQIPLGRLRRQGHELLNYEVSYGPELGAKTLPLLQEAVPGIRRIAILLWEGDDSSPVVDLLKMDFYVDASAYRGPAKPARR